jgi:regulator of protease activity HflC (stomatin/prohibitin superfamily)
METILVLILLTVLVVSLIGAVIKVVREYQRLVVLRLGRNIGAKGPGLVFLIPGVDRPIWVDLREQYLEIPNQTCITKDNAPIGIDFVIFWKVFNPADSVLQVSNFAGASQQIATTTLRAVIGDISLDDVLARREQINQVLRVKLDEVTQRWGVKVTAVEIREIQPPREVQEAMTRQMSAERNRRAVVTESDGKREATIKVAEGDKQSAILRAEGDRQAAVLRAEGFALALTQIYDSAKNIDSKTMSLQYLEALKALGQGQGTKIVLPMELTEMLKPVIGYAKEAMK